MAKGDKRKTNEQAEKCYICENPLTGQPINTLDLGSMQLKACKSCVEGGQE